MSYAICRVQKIKGASGITGIQIHNRRERGKSNSNPDIDRSRSQDNYSLIGNTDKSYNTLADERIKQGYTGKKAVRKDAVRLCEVLFTSDNNFFGKRTNEEQRQYFIDCFNWAGNRFGKENIISAIVHLDEATPHMHVDFVPLTADGRLTAYDVLGGKFDLQRMQDDFWEQVGMKWDLERGSRADLENPEADKPRSNKSTKEFKRCQRAAELDANITESESRLDQLRQQERDLQCDLESLRSNLATLQREIQDAQYDLDYYKDLQVDIKRLDDEEKKILGGISIIKTKAYAVIREQAKAYRINRGDIEQNRKNKTEIAKEKKEIEAEKIAISQRKTQVEELMRKADEAYNLQINLNLAFESINRELARTNENYILARRENAALRTDNDNKAKTIEDLRKVNRRAHEVLTDVVQATGMLKYDKKKGYKVAELTVQQERLIDGIANYSSSYTRNIGKHLDLAEKMDKHIGISDGIANQIDLLTPRDYSRGLSR